MKAITIWQPWASLISMGAKPYEFRRWAAPKSIVGQRIAIHAGARKMKRDEIQELLLSKQGTALDEDIARPYLEKVLTAPGSAPLSAVVCTAVLGRPRRATALFGGADSNRVDHHVWAWPLTEIEPCPPYPARGAQGFWDWSEADV